MKLTSFLEAEEQGFNVSEEDMERVFQVIKDRELDQRDIKGLANELVDEGGFSRSPGSAQFVINRMHILAHGVAPHGYSERSAEKMFGAAKPLLQFMQKKGYDVEDNIRRARVDLGNRTAQITQSQATQMMTDFFKQNKESIDIRTHKILKANREKIIADIMAGDTPITAFQNNGRALQKSGGQATPMENVMTKKTNLLNELLAPSIGLDVEEMTEQLSEYITIVEGLMDDKNFNMIMEAVADSDDIDVLIKQMEAAKRGLSILSKLKPGDDRGKHASRVMSNMNKIRGKIKRLQKAQKSAAGTKIAEAYDEHNWRSVLKEIERLVGGSLTRKEAKEAGHTWEQGGETVEDMARWIKKDRKEAEFKKEHG